MEFRVCFKDLSSSSKLEYGTSYIVERQVMSPGFFIGIVDLKGLTN